MQDKFVPSRSGVQMSLESPLEPQTGQISRSQMIVAPIEERLSVMDLWRVLIKRRIIILLATIAVFAGATFNTYRTKPVYESASRVEINPSRPSTVGLQGLVQEGQAGSETIALQTQLL